MSHPPDMAPDMPIGQIGRFLGCWVPKTTLASKSPVLPLGNSDRSLKRTMGEQHGWNQPLGVAQSESTCLLQFSHDPPLPLPFTLSGDSRHWWFPLVSGKPLMRRRK